MVKEDGKRIAEVARELDLAEREAQNRIRDLEEENAILKKAMGLFEKDQK
ncbi:hypothetical protein MM221_06650 [Salipaludibacillus sp. LMS25]|jgi:transposase|nr:hypothetical protein [Salipaludibacillus sp. LMS25]UTR16230.1 hypothetical protein MM221_06650 [Salipaludibacillus sp. LMS25]